MADRHALTITVAVEHAGRLGRLPSAVRVVVVQSDRDRSDRARCKSRRPELTMNLVDTLAHARKHAHGYPLPNSAQWSPEMGRVQRVGRDRQDTV